MKVTLIAHTPHPEQVVAAAAKLCYSDAELQTLLDGLDQQKSRDFVRKLASLGHESPTEHVSFTFGIEGVSRALLAQITRHRIASFSVQSQRYVRLNEFEFVTPEMVEQDQQSQEAFSEAMEQAGEQYRRIAAVLKDGHIRRLMKEGLDEKIATRQAEKMAIEDARFVLPNACTTKMMVTMNARSLNNFFRHRCCQRAQWEIRNLADEMLRLVYPIAPSLFENSGPGCVKGPCPEGAMSCSKVSQMREKYAALKKEAHSWEN